MVGYSGTPLAKKLGLQAGQAALLVNVPDGLSEIGVFAGFASIEHVLPATSRRQFDYIHVFETQRAVLEEMSAALFRVLRPDGMIWISWPKKSAKVPTSITEGALREILLPTGLVDVKVCAVDEIWSALKFMIRRELRGSL
ncbi:hypothetical protein FHX15_000420 [Rhizobium sp. BK650]|uniref:hypothetical protein n=1 Tax=Rhizobium sp. BK650 TaxID=2586990 RepID=UPI001617EF3F|nr:hypothetical protein [Rhizobium sp. BK650]MBB3655221.1 hypothetical protein [Rhizobium sp. BK650]